MLTLIDEYMRECLAVEVGVSIKSERVRQILEKVCVGKGCPEMIRSDNGSEFIGKALGSWLAKNKVKPMFIEQRSTSGHLKLAQVLQRRTTAFKFRILDSDGVQIKDE